MNSIIIDDESHAIETLREMPGRLPFLNLLQCSTDPFEGLELFEEILPDNRFVRIHKSFIIPLAKIDAIQNNRIVIGKSIIPIGDIYKTKFNHKILAVNI
jgi:hypothetical protein